MGMRGRRRTRTLPGKSPEQLAGMRTAGLVVARTLALLAESVRPGMSTLDLDTLAETHIRDQGGIPNFQLVPGYRHTLCTSVNEEIVHGIPRADKRLAEGDLLSVDCGAQVGTWNGDAAFSCIVGGRDAGSAVDLALADDTEEALWAGIVAMRSGGRLYAVGEAVEGCVIAAGERRGREYGIVEDYVGHGIGTSMHMDPHVPNFAIKGRSPVLGEGTTICVEPMVTLGAQDNEVLADDWTVVTRDRMRAAHWEHSIAVTSAGLCVLTALDGGAEQLARLGANYAPIDPA